jgi:hypothetical protein
MEIRYARIPSGMTPRLAAGKGAGFHRRPSSIKEGKKCKKPCSRVPFC